MVYSAAMESPLLQTKLHTPSPRPELVFRSRLLERLNGALHSKLTLISAPAGYGKTTLVSSWLHQQLVAQKQASLPLQTGWISFDEDDNSAYHFFGYLAAAIEHAPGIGDTIQTLLQMSEAASARELALAWLNDISAITGPFVLIMDDLHTITEPAAHDALAYLLDHLPPLVHLIITTRIDPLIPLARLRARGHMIEMRADDLRFTPQEAEKFLQQVMKLPLSAAQIAALEQRTEGWIAGLQMAALSMQGLADDSARQAFVANFTGSHRYIFDYLADEVLRQQSPQIQEFLLRTSVLDRLCGPLCDMVLGNQAENGAVTGMSIIDENGERLASKVSLYMEEEVSFESSDATIAGTLMVPDTPGPHPAVIIAHSSGVGERHGYWLFASHFARDGLAVLAYDRRGHGASTGGGPFNLNTDSLAEDMKAAYTYLQSHPEIDPRRIGLMGFSNGSWVAPRAAQDLSEVAFIAVNMASAVSQVEAELFRREAALRAIGVSEESIAQAMEGLTLYFKGAVSPLTEAEEAEFTALYQAIADNEELQSANGFQILPTDMPLEQILAGGGAFSFMGFSPTETYLSTDAPVAFFIGELDENIPPALSLAAMEEVIAQRPDADISLFVLPNATHSLFVLPTTVQGISQDLLIPNLAGYDFAPGYMEQLQSWLIAKTGLQ